MRKYGFYDTWYDTGYLDCTLVAGRVSPSAVSGFRTEGHDAGRESIPDMCAESIPAQSQRSADPTGAWNTARRPNRSPGEAAAQSPRRTQCADQQGDDAGNRVLPHQGSEGFLCKISL